MLMASHGKAGYTEYQLLAECSCEASAVSTDAAPPQANAPEKSRIQDLRIAKKSKYPLWSLNGNPELPMRWADCESSEVELAWTVIGNTGFQSVKCRLGPPSYLAPAAAHSAGLKSSTSSAVSRFKSVSPS